LVNYGFIFLDHQSRDTEDKELTLFVILLTFNVLCDIIHNIINKHSANDDKVLILARVDKDEVHEK